MASMSYYVSPSSYHMVQLNISLLAKSTPHLLLNHSQRIKYSKILSPLVKSSTHTQYTTSMLIQCWASQVLTVSPACKVFTRRNNQQETVPIPCMWAPSEVLPSYWLISSSLQNPVLANIDYGNGSDYGNHYRLMIMVLDREVVPPPWKFDWD